MAGSSDPTDPTLPQAQTAESDGLARTAPNDATAPTQAVGGLAMPHGRPVVRSENRPDFTELQPVDADNYVLADELARGGMGRIRRARDRRLGRSVAVKEVLALSGTLVLRFEREARLTARLQHPSIVSVHEAGVLTGGTPFYAMTLVRGRSLDVVIAEATTLDQRMALLPNVLAVADAMAYAHGERIIHRDLKPKNVLVGAFGETVVIDWGLAKDLSDTADIDPDGGGPYRASSRELETQHGEVMGTPAYMAPEQAKGDQVDERADVYAIGAMLTHVLSGRAPYEARSFEELCTQIEAGPPPPLVEREPRVPSDLLAIVGRAMARDRDHRYRTARELAEDLRKFQTGQLVGAHRYSFAELVRRWISRHRTPLIVAAVAAVVVVAIGVVSIRGIVDARELAERQRELADSHRAHAEDLTDFMLFDMKTKLEGVGRLDLLDAIAKKAAAYYGGLAADASPIERNKRSVALSNVGDVLAVRGDRPAAIAAYRSAIAISEQLITLDPTNGETQRVLGVAHDRLGTALSDSGDLPSGIREGRAALEILTRAGLLHPADATLAATIAGADLRLGDRLLKSGDPAGGLERFQHAVSIASRLAAGAPADGEHQRLLAATQQHVALALLARGQIDGAIEHHRAALAILETSATADPSNAQTLAALGQSHGDLGEVYLARGDGAQAIAELRAAVAVGERVVTREPGNEHWQGDLLGARDKLGNALLDISHDYDGALAQYRAALATGEHMAEGDPHNTIVQHGVGSMHQRIANVLSARGDDAHAIGELDRAAGILDAVAASDRSNAEWQRDPALVRTDLGAAKQHAGDLRGAVAAYRAAVELAVADLAAHPHDQSVQSDLALTRLGLGDALVASHALDDAAAEFSAANELDRAALVTEPDNADWQRVGVDTHGKLAQVCLKRGHRGDAATAVAEYRAAIEIEKHLNDTSPAAARVLGELEGGLARALARPQ